MRKGKNIFKLIFMYPAEMGFTAGVVVWEEERHWEEKKKD